MQKWVCLLLPNSTPSLGEKLSIDGDEFHYLANVLRVKVGTSLQLLNGSGFKANAKVESIEKKQLKVLVEEIVVIGSRLEGVQSESTAGRNGIELLIGLPKPSVVEDIVVSLSELGVSKIHFFRSENTAFKNDIKLEKLNSIARETLRVSKDTFATEVCFYANLNEFFVKNDFKKQLILADEVSENTLPISQIKSKKESITVLAVGPEASFSSSERKKFELENAVRVSLGENILRVHTACVAAAAILLNSCNKKGA